MPFLTRETSALANGRQARTKLPIAVVVLNTTHLTMREIIVPSFWIGWTVTLLAAELWIRAQRRERRVAAAS